MITFIGDFDDGGGIVEIDGIAFTSLANVADFTVDTIVDIPGLSACTPAPADCSLRGAIDASNSTLGMDIIYVPMGTYSLTAVGPDEDGNTTGDLDIADSVIIGGAGPGLTIIDGLTADRVFHITTE